MCFSYRGKMRLKGLLYKRGLQWRIFNRAGKDVRQKEEHDLTSLITKEHNTGSLHKGTKWDWKLKLHLKWKSGKGEGEGGCFMLEEGGGDTITILNYKVFEWDVIQACETDIRPIDFASLILKKKKNMNLKKWICVFEPERKKEH